VPKPVNNVRLISDECKPKFFLWRFDPKSSFEFGRERLASPNLPLDKQL
jgi:hypothetical protein